MRGCSSKSPEAAKKRSSRRAETQWNRARIAYSYLRNYIRQKSTDSKFALSVMDLVLVSNFKGGSASIAEESDKLATKLQHDSRRLEELNAKFGKRRLADLSDMEAESLSQLASVFCEMATTRSHHTETKINGFGPSYASALLNAYFPHLLPILDRRVLSALQIKGVETDSQGQVRELEKHYPALIFEVRRLASSRKCDLTEIDRELFVQPLAPQFQKSSKNDEPPPKRRKPPGL